MMTPTINRTTFEAAVAAAVRAPSLHNTQPWLFRLHPHSVEVWADPGRRLPYADPTGSSQRLALGASTCNLRLAFAVAGQPMNVTWLPREDAPALVAVLTPAPMRPPTPVELRLHAAIRRWRSHRDPFRNEPVPASTRTKLVEAAREQGVWLEFVTGHAAVAAVGEICQVANRELIHDEGYRGELEAWTRRGERGVDGVPSAAGGPSPAPHDIFPQRPFGHRERGPGREYEDEPLIAILCTTGDSPHDQLDAGYGLQRVLLTATDHGLSASLLSQPIEVRSAREQLGQRLRRRGVPQMVVRIGHGTPGSTTPRRPIEDVIEYG